MHPVAESVISSLDDSAYEAVARRVLGAESAVQRGTPSWSELSVAHNDRRTVAILRVEGSAQVHEDDEPWSAVVKLIDTSAKEGLAAKWVDPEKEEAVYEHGLFASGVARFRPARCYRIAKPKPNLKVFWLEDLTGAQGTPFSIPQLNTLASAVGEFNGHHASTSYDLPFSPAKDSYMVRWHGAGFPERVSKILSITDEEILNRVHRQTSPSIIAELHGALDELAQKSMDLPHTLSFGDCQPGNLFLSGTETVAIDWASLTMDPIGVDAGCLIGSAMTWGTKCAEAAEHERALFEGYLAGLAKAGWTGDPKDVRRGYFGQFGIYLMIICTVSTLLGDDAPEARRDFLEKRFQTPLEEIPDLLVPIIDMAPKYLEEVRSLLK